MKKCYDLTVTTTARQLLERVASWPDEEVIEGTLATIAGQVRAAKVTRTALILVGHVLRPEGFADSALYAPTHRHLFRHQKTG